MKADRSIVRPLLAWYRKNGRDLPWRKTSDPYKIWISEIMLQQTQVSRVIDYYARFLKRFPSVSALAESSWRNVLPLWRGLGYYHRGRNVLEAGKIVVRQHRAIFPKTYAELLALPGIGAYTANAVLTFAHGEAVPALDTNVTRVLSRSLGCTTRELPRRAEKLFEQVGRDAPSFNHALMDLGAALCRSRVVECPICPLRRVCAFHLSGKAEQLMRKTARGSTRKKLTTAIDVGAACIHRDGKYLLAKRSAVKGGEWEFPGGKREAGESIRACLKREIKEELGVEVAVRPAFLVSEARIGGKRYRLHFCRCQILRGRPKCKEHVKLEWVEVEGLIDIDLARSNRAAAKVIGARASRD